MLLWLCSPPCPLCPRDSPGQAHTVWLFRVPLPPIWLSFLTLPELTDFPITLGQPEADVQKDIQLLQLNFTSWIVDVYT